MPHLTERRRLWFDRAQVADWAARRGLAVRAGFLAPETGESAQAAPLTRLLRAGGIWRDVAAAEVPAVLAEVLRRMPGITPAMGQLLAQRVRQPGGLTWAPVGHGFALPHLTTRVSPGPASGTLAVVFPAGAVAVGEPVPDDEPVRRLVFFVAPTARMHLDVLARLSRGIARGPLRAVLRPEVSDAEIFRAVEQWEATLGGEGAR
jgi:PTS system nitrogen regulatory IIA component